jgi:hypothetical protein
MSTAYKEISGIPIPAPVVIPAADPIVVPAPVVNIPSVVVDVYNWTSAASSWAIKETLGGMQMFASIPAGTYELRLRCIVMNTSEHSFATITTPDEIVRFGSGNPVLGLPEHRENVFYITTTTAGEWRFGTQGSSGEVGAILRPSATLRTI